MSQTDNIDCAACSKPIRRNGKSVPGVGWYLDGPLYDTNNYCSKGCRWIGRREDDEPTIALEDAALKFRQKMHERRHYELKLEKELHDNDLGWPRTADPVSVLK